MGLSLAGIAVIWIFKVEPGRTPIIPVELFLPGILIISGLVLDLAQYVIGALFWGFYARLMEKKGKRDDDQFDAPRWINWPALVCFWMKIISMIVAYVFLFRFLWNQIA